MFNFKTFSFAIASLIFIAACNQQSETNSGSTATSTATSTTTAEAVSTDRSVITGVSSKGPISSALIQIYAFNASDGSESGAPIAATTTDSNGKWSVSIPAVNHTAALLIKSSGGSYIDESDPESNPAKKRTITFATDDSILGALFPGFNTTSITMMTAALIEKSRTEASGANFLSVLNNNRNIAAAALGFDPFTVASANPLAPSSAANVDSIEYAMYLGGMATALNSAAILMGKPLADFSVIEGFIHDMADGRLNGSNQSGPVSVLVNGTQTAFPTTINLNQAIRRFRNNNFAAYSVTPVTDIVTVNESILSTSGVNSAPNAVDDLVTTIENTAVVTPNLLTNDTDPDGDALTISGFNQPARGQISNNNNGSFTYTPNTGISGSDIFSYTVSDGKGGSDTANVIITIVATSTNANPIAITDTVSTNQNVAVTTPNLLANDSDPNGHPVTLTSFTQPGNGIVTNNNNGTFNYTPANGFSGVDNFSYTISDGQGGTATGTVNINVIRINANPIAVNDSLVTNQDTAVTTTNLLLNDSDPDGNPITISNFTQPANGFVSSNNNGSFNYTPGNGFSGNTSFTYTISDGLGGLAIATVNVTVISTNTSPIAVDDSLVTNQDTAATTINLLINDSDPDGDPLTISNFTQPANGLVTNNNNGTFNYTPNSGFTGIDSFTYTVSDGLVGGTAVATVNITVNLVNSNMAPVANAGIDQNVNELTLINLGGSGIDGDGSISAYRWQQISGTAVTVNNSNSPNANFTSPEVLIGNISVLVFQLIVTDNQAAEGSDFITIIVNPVAIAPTANAGPDQSLNEQLVVNLDGSASSDDRSIVTYAWSQTAGSPTITLTNANTATPSFTGPDITNNTTFRFQLTVTDDEGGSHSDTVDINLISLNAGPAVVDDPGVVTDEDSSVVINNLLANDSDPEGDSFTISSVTQPANGAVVILTGDTSVSYTPGSDFNGVDTFSYLAVDEFGAFSIASALVSVTVTGVNDDPSAVTDSASTNQGFPVTISNLLDNDTDPENDTLAITGITQPGNGLSVNNGDGTVTYTPDLAFNGSDSFSYSIVDGNGGSATGTINITIVADTDGDGITDTQEGIDGTNPNLADSDGDGFFDGHEKLVGTDPNLNNEFPPTTIISSTNANDDISSNTTWGLANSPYWLQTDVSIRNGATLTIEPGVVIKSNSNVDILINSGGLLAAQGNAPEPQHIVFTDARDDSINGDTNVDGIATAPAGGGWRGLDFQSGSAGTLQHTIARYGVTCIDINNSSPVISNTDVGDCTNYGINVSTSSGTQTTNLNGINVIDYNSNGQSTTLTAIRIHVFGNATNILNLSNLNIDEAGNGTNYGLYLFANGGSISGTVSNLVITNSNNDGLNILNNSSGSVNVDFDTVSITAPGGNGSGIDINNSSSGSIATSFDGTNSILNTPLTNAAITITNNNPDFLATGSWAITNAGYGLSLSNSDGNFNHFTLDNMSIAGIQLANASDPAQFSNIVLTNAITPYELQGQNLTATIIAGYNFSDASVTKDYIRLNGTLLADSTLTPDPLATGSSVWRITSALTVPAGVTLNVADGAIVKLDLNIILTINGTFSTGDGDGSGNNAILTSIRDDSVGNDLGDPVAPAAGDWNYILVNTGSIINVDNAILRYMSYGFLVSSATPASFSIINSTLTDFRDNAFSLVTTGNTTFTLNNLTISNGTQRDAIAVSNTGAGNTVTLDFDDITIDNIGNTSDDRGIEILVSNNAILTGRLDNITISNTAGTGLYIQDFGTGLVNPTLSGLNITNPGLYGLQIIGIGDGTTSPTIDNSSPGANINFIGNANASSGGVYGLLVQDASGSYSHITFNNTSSSALFVSGVSNPSFWQDSSIIINNSPAPWTIQTLFPPSIGILGSADLGYTAGTGLAQSYIQLNNILSNTLLVADPLNTGTSGWLIDGNLTIPAGATLTVNDGAIVKVGLNVIITVNGSLITGDGDGMGPQVIFTSIRDDSVGDDLGDPTAAARNDWNYILVNSNSVIDVDNAIIRYMNYGFLQSSTTPLSFSVTNSTITEFREWGFSLTVTADATFTIKNTVVSNGTQRDGIGITNSGAGSTITLDFDGVTVDTMGNTNDDRGIDIVINNNGLLTGRMDNITVSNTFGTGIYIQDTGTGLVDPVLSGLNISNPLNNNHGLQLIGIGDGSTRPTVDNSSGSINLIGNANAGSGGYYGLLVQDSSGIYSHITIDNTTSSALFLSGISNPLGWDDSSIIINNSPSPWTIQTLFPASIGVLGTADLGYTAGTGLTQSFIQLNGTLANTVLVADPLNTTTSGWLIDSNLTIPSGVSLTVNDGAIVKVEFGVFVTVNGSFITGDGDGLGPKSIFTSIRDDSVGDDLGDPVAAARSDWLYFLVNANSVINVDNAIIRYMDYGFLTSSGTPATFSVINSTLTEFRDWGFSLRVPGNITFTLNNLIISNGTQRDGIAIEANGSGNTITLDFDDITVDSVGNTNDDRGIEIIIRNNGLLTGRMDNITVSNTAGSGIYIQDLGTGLVDPVLSGITITNPLNNTHGIQLIGSGDGTTTPTLDNSNPAANINLIGDANANSGGFYGLYLEGVNGSYSHITIENTIQSALYFSNNSNPSVFDGTTITLSNSPSPYTLAGMSLPAAVTSTPYQAGTGLVQDYVIFTGALINDLTLEANPLGGTFWRLISDLDVPSGRTLTIEANTLIKFNNGFFLDVLSGGSLNVNGTLGNEVIMTSFTDNSVGTPDTSLILDWEGVRFNPGSNGTVNYLTTWYGRDGVNITNSSPTLNNLTVNYSQEGVKINSTTTTSPVFSNLEIYECSATHLFLDGAGIMSPTFTGNSIITDIDGTNGTRGIYTSSADTTSISGFTITGSNTGIEIAGTTGANRIENNIIRQTATVGISMTADGGPLVRNNIIVNNGGNSAGGGIYINSGNGIIFGNLIRDNRAGWGAGIAINNSSPTIENNLIIENRSSRNSSVLSGSGIYISGNSSAIIKNNTIANNVSADTLDEGAGISTEATSGTVTLIDNIIFGNIDGNAAPNDVYDETNSISTNNNNLIGTILNSGSNLYTADASDIVGSDPLFTNGWYLTEGGPDSPAIDAGSTLASLITPFELASLTTRTDGITDANIVNIGYHYAGSAPTVSAGNSIVSPVTLSVNGSVVIVITITPLDSVSATIGAGLDVVASATASQRLSDVTDLADGSYQVTYTTPLSNTGNDIVTFTVNGVAITANAALNWAP